MKRLSFDAFDTLFFREARPMESIGAKPLAGRFPPPARTLAGAVRGLAGEALGVDWRAYRDGEATQDGVEAVIGKAKENGLGQLKLTGPYPVLNGQRLYPVPLSLFGKPNAAPLPEGEGVSSEYARLLPGEATDCDLGRVKLPVLAKALPGAKPLENVWLDADDMNRVLAGEEPVKPVKAKQLFSAESRLGIAINSHSRSVEEGLLYQTVHARPEADVRIGVEVEGLPDTVQSGVVRLGGEGRFARVDVATAAARLQPKQPKGSDGVLLALLTPALFKPGEWHPPGFVEGKDGEGATVWRGKLENIELTIIASVIGKPVREGGWDLAKHQSRPATPLIPAGTVFFCTVKDSAAQAVEVLQGKKIGFETEWGRGELAVGYWEGVNK